MHFLYNHPALSGQKSDCSSLRGSGELLPRKSRDVYVAVVKYEYKDSVPLLSEKTGASHSLFNLRDTLLDFHNISKCLRGVGDSLEWIHFCTLP